jgi:tRNA(Ile)-lysidine synthase
MFPLQSFKTFITQNDLFRADQKILLAVSGGKDSVLLVHLFKLAGFNFGIAHCNFNLREEESQRDENFVKDLAASQDVPFFCTSFKTKAYAKGKHLSTQMAARELRYTWFEEIRQRENYDYVAVAHHQNDAIETVLLNLTRGTGISGLHGILPKRDKLIRPLLFLSRTDIDTCIARNNVSFVEDSSNRSDYYARNKLRLNVVPQLKEINPNLEYTFSQNIQRFADTEDAVQQLVEIYRKTLITKTSQGFSIEIENVKALHPQKFLLFELLKPYNFSAAVIGDLLASLDRQSGTSFFSTTHRITINRASLLLSQNQSQTLDETKQAVSIEAEDTIITFKEQQITIGTLGHLESEISNKQDLTSPNPFQFNMERNRAKAFVDQDLLIYPLTVRSWLSGDVFQPLGMKNKKKLSNYFIDEKVPLPEKANIPILVNGNGELIWIAGMRQDNRYKVSPNTKKVVIFELKFK